MKYIKLLSATVFGAIILSGQLSFANKTDLKFSSHVQRATHTLLTSEIARDKGYVETRINTDKLKAIRASLKSGLASKENLVTRWEMRKDAGHEVMVEALKATIETEKRIAEGKRVGHRARQVARNLLKRNLVLKESMLETINTQIK